MSTKQYSAVFHPEPEAGGYSVFFPDLPGCYTQGDTLDEAISMAEDALGLYLYTLKADKKAFPPATNPADIETSGRDFTTLITWDEAAYLRRVDNRSVKKTLTIPAWMDTLARERNINFSQLLQNAIRRECGIQA